MSKIRTLMAWLLIVAMLIPGFAMAEDIEDAVVSEPVIEEIMEVEPVQPETVPEEPVTGTNEPVEETVIEDAVIEGPAVLDILAEEFGMQPEKICWLLNMTAEEINAAGIEAVCEMIETALEAREIEDAEVEEPAEEIEALTVDAMSGKCGANLNWSLSSGVLSITGTGRMYDWSDFETVPWYDNRENIKSISIGSGVTTIGENAFYNCEEVSAVTIPSGVEAIGDYAFDACYGLEKVTINGTNATIGRFAFGYCFHLTTVTMSSTLSSRIDKTNVFWGTPWLDSHCSHSNKYNNLFCKDCGKLYGSLFSKQPVNVTAAAGTTAQFTVTPSCPDLLNEYYWYRITDDEEWEFIEGQDTSTLRITATQDKNNCRYACSILTYYTLRDEEYALWQESDLATLTVDAMSGKCGENVYWSLNTSGTLSITGTGDMYDWDYEESNRPWEEYCEQITRVTIGSDVTSIGIDAFKCCYNLVSVTIPNTVKVINGSAFECCVELSSISIPSGVEEIYADAFRNCPLTSVTIPSSVVYVGYAAFMETWLETVTLLGNDTVLDDLAFARNWELMNVSMSSTLRGKTNLSSVFYGAPWLMERCSHRTTYHDLVCTDCGEAIVDSEDIFTRQPQDVTAAVGTTARFEVETIDEDFGYQWYQHFPGSDSYDYLDGEDCTTLLIPVTVDTQDCIYECDAILWIDIAGTDIDYRWCSDDAALTVVRTSVPVITTQPVNRSVSVGQTATFTVAATGTGLSYQWQYRASASAAWANTSQPGNTTATLSVPATTARNGYQYRCIVRNSAGSVTSAAATLTVTGSLPVITSQPANRTATVGATAQFTVAATGTGLSYQWQYRASASAAWANTSQPGNTTATLSVPATTARNGYQYRCKVTNASGSVYSNAATLTVTGNLPVITSQPRNVTATEGSTAQFSVTATGTGLSYQWQFYYDIGGSWMNTSQPGNTTATLSVPATTARNGYQYRCKVTNASGSVYSNAATLTVTAGLPVITSQPRNVSTAAGTTAQFTVTATGSGLSYQWQCYDSTLGWYNTSQPGNTTATLSVPATTARNGYQYRCRVSNAKGVVYSNTVTLTVIPSLPEITSQPVSVTTAVGTTARFTVAASGTGLTYQWQYRTSASGAWANTSQTGNTTATLSVPATAARNGYQYRCKVTNASGSVYSNAATLNVASQPPVVTNHPQNASVAVGTNVQFTVTATGSGLSYLWQFKAPGSTSWGYTSQSGYATPTLTVPVTEARFGYLYRCKVSNSAGVVYSDPAMLTITGRVPVITRNPVSVSASTGATATFTVTATGATAYRWQYRTSPSGTWMDTTLPGSTTNTLTVPVTANRTGHQYRCRVSNSAGSVYSIAVTFYMLVGDDMNAGTNSGSGE